ncbi:hypothetical protein CR513_16743, partial [Mucuna pruriens]
MERPNQAVQSGDPAWASNLAPSSSAATSPLEEACSTRRIIIRCFSRLRKCRSKTERPKVVKGDCLARHCNLVDLILSVLTNRGEPSPFNHGDCRGERTHRIHTLCLYFTTKYELYQIGAVVGDTKSKQMENNDRTLKELATPDMAYQPWRRSPQAIEGIPCGLMMMDQSMIDAASGGALMDKTPTIARHLISNMASSTQ